jgi:2-haloacid dehalogenase
VTTPRVLLFDVFGTVVDWRSSLVDLGIEATAGTVTGWPEIIDDWRRAYQPAMDRVRGGEAWRDLDSLQRETLAQVTARRGVDLPDDVAERLVLGWRRLPPWPDSREGLERLRASHLTATLSNGHLALLADLVKFGDLRFDVVLSAQLASSYKPEPVVYTEALRLLGCAPGEAAMVAAHAGDLRAAAAVGIRPVFVHRPAEWGPGPSPESPPALDGLVEVADLIELAGYSW